MTGLTIWLLTHLDSLVGEMQKILELGLEKPLSVRGLKNPCCGSLADSNAERMLTAEAWLVKFGGGVGQGLYWGLARGHLYDILANNLCDLISWTEESAVMNKRSAPLAG